MAQEEFFYPLALAATPRLNGRQLLIVISRKVAVMKKAVDFSTFLPKVAVTEQQTHTIKKFGKAFTAFDTTA